MQVFYRLRIKRGVGTAPDSGLPDHQAFREGPTAALVYDLEGLTDRIDFVFRIAWSDRVVAALKSNGCTGFEEYSITVKRKGESVDGFVGVKITGTGGEFDGEASEAEFFSSGRVSGYQRIMMRAGWDGSDVFLIPGLGEALFFSEKAFEVLSPLKLRGAKLIRNTDCSM